MLFVIGYLLFVIGYLWGICGVDFVLFSLGVPVEDGGDDVGDFGEGLGCGLA